MKIELWRQATQGQYEAALVMMRDCLEGCSESTWAGPIANLRFDQSVFHALFYTDLYLGQDEVAFKAQPYHQQQAAMFADYEELEDRVAQQTYTKAQVRGYLEHCLNKAREVVSGETDETLAELTGFPWLPFSLPFRCKS